MPTKQPAKRSLIATILFSTPPTSLSTVRAKSGNPNPDYNRANEAKMEKAQKLYFSVMGTEWTSTPTIESRLGRTPGTCLAPLNNWLALGLVERRKLEGKLSGWEWRVTPSTNTISTSGDQCNSDQD